MRAAAPPRTAHLAAAALGLIALAAGAPHRPTVKSGDGRAAAARAPADGGAPTPGSGGRAATGAVPGSASSPPGTGDFLPAAPGHAWSFPRDHAAHPGYRNEWWYFTGQLTSVEPPGRIFGYQLTFFRVGLVPRRPPFDSPWAASDAVMVHAAVSDVTGERHVFSEVLWRAMPYLGDFPPFPARELAWARAPAGTAGTWRLELSDNAFTFAVEDRAVGLAYRLSARPERPLVFQGPDGVSRKSSSEGYASLYYSFTRLATEGTVALGAREWTVRGLSWMDREIGSSQLAPTQVGWDWFGLQLADGRDLMLYLLRRADGSVDFARGTVVGADGAVRWLRGDEFTVRATATWRSPATRTVYPAAWRVEVPSAGIALEVAPAFADQEDRGSLGGGIWYWEGAVRLRDASGRAAGAGYVELTGYGERTRPPI